MKTLATVYKSEILQKKWLAAVAFLRTESKTKWVLDREVKRK